MVMLESLACGTPVVGCPRGAAPEIVEHGLTGYLGESDAELVAGLLAIGDIDRGVCRDEARRRFSVERMVQQYVRLFERIIADPTGAERTPYETRQPLAGTVCS